MVFIIDERKVKGSSMKLLNEKVLAEHIEKTISSDIREGKVGGASVAVMQNGKTVYQKHFSSESIGVCVSDQTMFRLASMTKPITTVAVLMLVDRGLLDLDTKVSELIPEFGQMYIGRMQDRKIENVTLAKTPITVRHLLSHCSGLGSGVVGDYIRNQIPLSERTSLEKVTAYYAQNPLDFEPATRQFYSGIHGFDVLARIVEIVSGISFDVFLAREIFEPLNMTDTTFLPTKEQWDRMIPLHNYVDGVASIAHFPENTVFGGIPTSCCCGGAGLASTLDDYKKFANMLLRKGNADGKQLVSEKLITELATPQLSKKIMGGDVIWGLGVRIVVSENYKDLPVGAYGWSGACGTHFWVDPENDIVAIYMKNSVYDGGSGAKTARQFEKDVNAALYA